MNNKPLFVVKVTEIGNFWENGYAASHHESEAAAYEALEKTAESLHDRKLKARVEDWTPTPAQVEAFRESQEW